MWGRLKRRIMRSKTGGIYSSSQDEGFSECRDTYRDFREELYDESKENPNWKEGKSGKKLSLTKTPFPNLDRCSCGTPGGKNSSEILVKSENLKRKSDFLNGADARAKVQSANKSNNDYTSTSTGPGTRNRVHDGEETRMRGSTSTGQIPQTVDEQAVNGMNSQRASGHSSSAEIRRRRMTYSDDDNDDETDDDDDDDDDDDIEEDEDGGKDQFRPSTSSKALGSSSRTGGGANKSNCSDYTSLAFDLNYVKVSPPKLRRRRKKIADTTDAPLMVRRERSAAPKPLPAEHPPRSDRKVSNASVEGVDAGPSSGGGAGAALRSSPPEHQQPAPDAVKQSPSRSTTADNDGNNKDQAGYISWVEARHLLPQNASATKNETPKCEPPTSEEPAARTTTTTNCGITTSGSLLQFTFTVRLDNDVIRGARRGSEQGVVGPSLVSGRVDILSPGILMSTSENIGIRNHVAQPPSSVIHITTQKEEQTGTSDTVTRNCPVDVPLNAEHDKATSNHAKNTDIESIEVEAERPRDGTKGGYGTKTQNPDIATRSAEDGTVVKAAPIGGTPAANHGVLSSSCKQQASGMQSNHGTTVTTTAIVHKSASEDEIEEEETDGTENTETKDSDADQVNSRPIRNEERGFDEVDFVPKRQFHEKISKTPVTSDSENERTHMNWDEVLEEAQSLGIPLTRPAAHCRDCSRDRSAASPSKRTDNYWVCSSCTEALQSQQQQQQRSSRKTASKTSSPFKDKFKLQTIFGCKRGKDEKTGRCHQDVMSYPPAQTHCSPSSKYKTMPTSAAAAAASNAVMARSSPDIHKCIWSVSRSGKQTGRGRSMSPALTVRCGTVGSSPRASSGQCRGDTRGQQRISHLCSPPQHRCRFSYGRTVKVTSRSSSESASNHISTDVLASSSPPKIRRPATIDRDFLKSLAQLMGCSWYWGSLSFESAEVELSDRLDGCFLVRDSSDDRYILSISFRSLRSTHHIRIERHEGKFSFSSEQGLHESSDVVEFIERAMEISQGGQCLYYLRPRTPTSPPVPVQLLYPLSRFAH